MAARMENQREAREIRHALRQADVRVDAAWIDETPSTEKTTDEDRQRRLFMDLGDVTESDVLVLFKPSGLHRSSTTGGHHVEVGYALALGKPVFVIGSRENLFHWHPSVRECDSTEAAVGAILALGPEDFVPNPQSVDSYQKWTLKPAKYPDAGKGTGRAICYAVTGLGGETGELIEKISSYLKSEFDHLMKSRISDFGDKKVVDEISALGTIIDALARVSDACKKLEDLKREIREGRMNLPDMRAFPQELVSPVNKECGDVAWYQARLPNELGLKSSFILQTNVDKLEKRIVKGTLHGKGDER